MPFFDQQKKHIMADPNQFFFLSLCAPMLARCDNDVYVKSSSTTLIGRVAMDFMQNIKSSSNMATTSLLHAPHFTFFMCRNKISLIISTSLGSQPQRNDSQLRPLSAYDVITNVTYPCPPGLGRLVLLVFLLLFISGE